jgi:hypothetical protein
MRYSALYFWLAAHQGKEVHAAFGEIEAILGFGLPATARRRSQWWENNHEQHVQAGAWLDAGFRTQEINIANETVTFCRDQG